jgi:tetratricopeptide (TPR) repeat protein
MLFRLLRVGLVALLCLGLCGCPRPAENQTDEQRSAHYLAAKEKLAALDYKGAIESFERATEDNPRSALAHFELAVLYETKENDYAAALYHYNKALKLRPNGYPADNIKQRIPGCRQEMVKADSLAVMQPTMLRETERLRDENQALRKQIEALQAQLAARSVSPTNPPSNSGANPGASSRGASGSTASGLTQTVSRAGGPGVTRLTSLPDGGRTSPPATRARTHSVKSGETPTAIARSYGVRLDALLAANPGLDARKLKVGQSLNVPAP